MILGRKELEAREAGQLAPYAQKCQDSLGRRYDEPKAKDRRTLYQRDRDRIIHTRAFRRLEYKTQVFLNWTGDHVRTRLTHTIEMASISRNLCRFLGLNEDLAEAIALAHDLGHAPFGHNGDEVLDWKIQCKCKEKCKDKEECKRKEGWSEGKGFEHNRQAQRIVEELERKFPGFPGLNLSWEVLEGLGKGKHRTPPSFKPEHAGKNLSLEAQIVDVADEIAYRAHDLEDGICYGPLSDKHVQEELQEELPLWREARLSAQKDHPEAEGKLLVRIAIRTLIDRLCQDVLATTKLNLEELEPPSAAQIRDHDRPLAGYSPEMELKCKRLRDFLYKNLYHHSQVHEPNKKCTRMLGDLFDHYMKNPEDMEHPEAPNRGKLARKRGRELRRSICDYIAGMTDLHVLRKCSEHGLLRDPASLGLTGRFAAAVALKS